MSKKASTKASSSRTNVAKTATLTTAKPADSWKAIITTATAVSVWNTENRCDNIFNSGSEGIVSAKVGKDGNILAVAGNQVVVLHKIERGQRNSYKLKGADAQSQLLEYAADGKNIFITSSFHNCVQTYSINDDRITANSKAHPSPVTSFALSPDSTVLLSSSANPPTTYIDNLNLRTTTQLKPKASDHKVILTSYHPTRKNVFLLAFSDGVLAAFDNSKANKGQHIHAFGHLHDASIGGNGITGAEFIPGSQTRAVTAGEDGRLFVVDFEQKDVLNSFNVGAPVTSLSLRTAEPNGKASKGTEWFAAVGTAHGWCYIYDHHGKKVKEMRVDPDGNKVLEVRWTSSDIKIPPNSGVLKPPIVTKKVATADTLPPPSAKAPKSTRAHKAVSTVDHDSPARAEKPLATTSLLTTKAPKPPAMDTKEVILQKPLEIVMQDQDSSSDEYQGDITADCMSFSPVKYIPRRSTRLSIRSTNSPGKDNEAQDFVSKMIKHDQERKLKPSISSPSLAAPAKTSKLPRSAKKAAVTFERIAESSRSVAGPSRPSFLKPEVATKKEQIDKIDSKKQDISVQELVQRPGPSQELENTSDSKTLSDFRDVRAKIESSRSGHGKPALSLFAPYMPNSKAFKASSTAVGDASDKENLTGSAANKVEEKAVKKGVKTEQEKKRRRPIKEDRDKTVQLKGEEEDDTMSESPSQQEINNNRNAGNGKRKDTKRARSEIEDVWMSEDAKTRSKRVNLGDPSASTSLVVGEPRGAHRSQTADEVSLVPGLFADLKKTVKDDIRSLRLDMETQFREQRRFFENLVREERRDSDLLRTENDRLRLELSELLRFSAS